MKRFVLSALVLLSLICGMSLAETPDQCAARLDQTIAIKTYDEAAEWWVLVQEECGRPASQPDAEPTYDPSKGYTAIYGWNGTLDFCVMSPTLNIRAVPNGAVFDRFDKGDVFSVDLASQTLVAGFVWGKHDKGWSALFSYPGGERIDELTYPEACPTPTPRPTATRVRREIAQATPTQASQGAAWRRYRNDSSYRKTIDSLIQGYAEVYAGSLCGVLSGSRDCRKHRLYANVASCVLKQALYSSDTFEETASKAENFIGKSISTMLRVEAFVNSGGLDKSYSTLSADEKALVDGLDTTEQCFYELEA